MKKRIFRAICLCAVLAALIASCCAVWITWRQTTAALQDEVRAEADFAAAGMEQGGQNYLATLGDSARRLTLIDPDGTVVFDNQADTSVIENHLDRPEVAAAFAYGSGEDLRTSQTLTQRTFYRALRLKNGQVLRLSATTGNVLSTLPALLPFLLVLFLAVGIGSVLLARWEVGRIIEPINRLDLDHPQNCYDELSPLVRRIEEQNQRIQSQMLELERHHQETEQLRREFTANVSHELKTPLQTISGSAEIILGGLVPPADQPGFMERIYQEAQRLITLVEDILRLSKLDEGAALKLEQVDLTRLAHDTVGRLEPTASQDWIALKVAGQGDVVTTDRRLLEEILYNLVDNAIKYNKPGGSVTVTLSSHGFTVTDTGIGIPPQHQERIFERFYRVDPSRSKTIGGTGLGLSIVKHALNALGGQIALESAPGVGTTVTVTLPET